MSHSTDRHSPGGLRRRIAMLERMRDAKATQLIFTYEPGTNAFERCSCELDDIEIALQQAMRLLKRIEERRTNAGGDS